MNALHRRSFASLLALALLAQAACSAPPTDEPAQSDAGAPAVEVSLDAARDLGVRNATMPVPGLVVAGQLTPEQLDGLVAAGFESFISLRSADEEGAGWEEEHTRAASIPFHRLPIAGGDGLTRGTAEELARLLDAGGENTVLYCASGNRAGSLLALKAYFVDGQDRESALELGRAAGMTRLEARVEELMAPSGG